MSGVSMNGQLFTAPDDLNEALLTPASPVLPAPFQRNTRGGSHSHSVHDSVSIQSHISIAPSATSDSVEPDKYVPALPPMQAWLAPKFKALGQRIAKAPHLVLLLTIAATAACTVGLIYLRYATPAVIACKIRTEQPLLDIAGFALFKTHRTCMQQAMAHVISSTGVDSAGSSTAEPVSL